MSARAGAALALAAAVSAVTGPVTAATTVPATAYVLVGRASNQFVMPVNTATGQPGTDIAVGKSNSGGTIVATPDGQTLYVVNTAGVTAISTATQQVIATIALPYAVTAAAVTPDGSTLYVATGHDLYAISTATKDTVTPVSTATNKPGTPIKVGDRPDFLAMAPNGATVYVSTGVPNHVGYITPISTATGTVGKSIAAGFDSGSFVIAPDGQTGYVEGSVSRTITPIDLAAGTAGKPVNVGSTPDGIVISPDSTTAYVSSSEKPVMVPVDVATGQAGGPIKEAPAGQVPDFPAFTPDGSALYVVNASGVSHSSLTAIDTATNTAGQPYKFGGYAYGIVITS
ncbi:MAG TPA: hypothetical protein VGH27_05140 [Streptosporangiaceae bacterium]